MKKINLYLLIMSVLCISNIMYSQSPNLVVIIADDMGWSQTSSSDTSLNNPSDFYETPVIANLANEGIAFPNAYINGANCAPTRAAILSGQWASRPTNNVFDVGSLDGGGNSTLLVPPSQGLPGGEDEIPAGAITIAETLKTSGYTTAHFGKYHVGDNTSDNGALDQGFDFNYGGSDSGTGGPYTATNNGGNWQFGNRIGPELDLYADPYTLSESLALAGDSSLDGVAKNVTDAMAEAAIDFMNNNNSSPFFIHFSNYAIHQPWAQANARPDLYAKYSAKNSTNLSQMGHDNVVQAAILEGMDQTIGRLVDYLKTTPDPRNPGNMLSANTLVYFISDNGGANGPEDNGPLQGMKGEYKEGGIRSVTFAWSEGLLANTGIVNNTPIQAFDLYPTLAQAAGASLPNNYDIDGVSQWDMLTGVNSDLGRDALFWHYPGYVITNQKDQRPSTIIRKGDYKLIHDYETGSYRLYDLANDIDESDDLLLGSPDSTTLAIANDMSIDLRNYVIDVSAPLPTFRSSGNTVPLPEVIPTDGGGSGGGCTITLIDSHDFESGWGIWNNGGSDCRRNINDAAYANSGSYCIRLRDNTSTSVVTTDTIDLSSYEEITLDFSYYCRSMDNVNEDFWLQISTDGGASFTTQEEWNLNDEFVNDQRYNDQVTIFGPFTTTTQLRFRADASANNDWVYIDDVVINGCITNSLKTSNLLTENENEKPQNTNLATKKVINSLYPNPFKDQLNILIHKKGYKKAELQLINSLGQVVLQKSYQDGQHIKVSTQNLPVGQYFVKLNIDNEQEMKQLIKE